MIQKLSQEVINQIAAGEVVERPSSVIKELIDNAIDAKATQIDIKIKAGGKKYIEVSDDGIGIEQDDLAKTFEAHTTSKIQNISDLNEILSMGFRGEALSTIVSVSEVTMFSKHKNSENAYKITGAGITISSPVKHPRDLGTTIIVENLFQNIPARLKYLRADNTEYRKILETTLPYFLIYPNIHFTFSNNGKQIYNLPKIANSQEGNLQNTRISGVLKSDFTKTMLSVFYDGDGIKVSGFVAQPQFAVDRTSHQYFFLNKRPIYDSGVAKAVSQAFTGFIPTSKRIPFIISLDIKPSLVDVNVHPRKEEVRFMNPFRVYSAVEQAVKQALKSHSVQEVSFPQEKDMGYQLQDGYKKGREVNYKKSSNFSVQSGLKFSEHLLKPKVVKQSDMSLFKNETEGFSCFQIFKKYVIVEFTQEIWIVDQHAASERIHYENLQRALEVQTLLVPEKINLSEIEMTYLNENEEVFKEFGFNLKIEENSVEILEIPANLAQKDMTLFFKDLLTDEELAKNIAQNKEKFLYVIACHASIRSGQKLSDFEMQALIKDFQKCENSIACPHGRPAIWKLNINEIDSKFHRT